MYLWQRSQQNLITFVLVDSSGDVVPGLGSSFTLQVSKAGGAFSPGAGTKNEIGSGWYSYLSTAGEADTIGPVSIVITHPSIKQQNLEYVVLERTVLAVEFTYTLTEPDLVTPIANAVVRFSTNYTGTNTVWSGTTDTFGVARDINGLLPRLDPGTYYVHAQKSGYVFPVDTEVVP